jgi:hypothetical protein
MEGKEVGCQETLLELGQGAEDDAEKWRTVKICF